MLCMVMVEVFPNYSHWRSSEAPNLDPAEQAISNTWGKQCTKTIYFGVSQLRVPSIIINSTRSIDSWRALREAITYVSSNEKLYDWYMIVEDDTYIIYENLLYFLAIFDENEAHYLGHAVVNMGSQYNSIGSGKLFRSIAIFKVVY